MRLGVGDRCPCIVARVHPIDIQYNTTTAPQQPELHRGTEAAVVATIFLQFLFLSSLKWELAAGPGTYIPCSFLACRAAPSLHTVQLGLEFCQLIYPAAQPALVMCYLRGRCFLKRHLFSCFTPGLEGAAPAPKNVKIK